MSNRPHISVEAQREILSESRDGLPPATSAQKVMVDFILAGDIDYMSEIARQRLVQMVAAYAGVCVSEVKLLDVVPTNSSLVRIEMPLAAAERIILGFQSEDPRLASFLDEFAVAQKVVVSVTSLTDSPSHKSPERGDAPSLDEVKKSTSYFIKEVIFGMQGSVKLIETARPSPAEKPPVTNVKEEGLESLIVGAMTSFGWVAGVNQDYDREHAVDLKRLTEFLEATQEEVAAALELRIDGTVRRKFLARLQGEITRRALDLALFINGLPVATFELKNSLTKQAAEDAVEQYKRDRSPRETLFAFGRCVVHLAMGDHEVQMCTELKGRKGMAKNSWFLPFNQGWNAGAGNPPNPYGIKTDYLWRRILTPGGLVDILENYAQIVEQKNEQTGRMKRVQIFPRYHQLDVVRKLLADATWFGAGKRYLIQHSAGSGKSNSIAWLAHQLIGLRKDGANVFDSVILVTDRLILDKQIRETIKGFAQVGSIIGAVKGDGGRSKTEELTKFLRDGKKIIISTVQTFPFVLDNICDEHRNRKFAIIIDEAHSSQGGKTAGKLNMTLAEDMDDYGGGKKELEDRINDIIQSRKMLSNASYFAFTATPKNKTLQLFGIPYAVGDEIKHVPFHSYTMKQAIEEGFILDVLRSYAPVESYYRLAKTVAGDPEYDVKKARKKLRVYVESHSKAIRDKAEIMVDHFHEQVIGQNKIG